MNSSSLITGSTSASTISGYTAIDQATVSNLTATNASLTNATVGTSTVGTETATTLIASTATISSLNCTNESIAANGTLTINGTLNIASGGSITGSGNIVSTSSNLTCNGLTCQSITDSGSLSCGALTCSSLTDSGSLTVNGSTTFGGAVSLGSSHTLSVNQNSFVTVGSGSSGTISVGGFGAYTQVGGTFSLNSPSSINISSTGSSNTINLPNTNITVGAITCTSETDSGALTCTGNISTSGYAKVGNSTSSLQNTSLAQGGYVSWNSTASQGELDFIASKGTGTGGFNFYSIPSSSTGTYTPSVAIDGSGNLTAVGAVTCAGVTSSGAISCGTNSLTCGALSCSSETDTGTLTVNNDLFVSGTDGTKSLFIGTSTHTEATSGIMRIFSTGGTPYFDWNGTLQLRANGGGTTAAQWDNSGNLSCKANVSTSGGYLGVTNYSTSTLITGSPAQGAYMGWNYQGNGRVNFMNSRGTGSGGFEWYDVATSNTTSQSPIMTLDTSGNLTCTSLSTTSSGTVTVNGNSSITQNLTVGGNLTVNGTAVTHYYPVTVAPSTTSTYCLSTYSTYPYINNGASSSNAGLYTVVAYNVSSNHYNWQQAVLYSGGWSAVSNPTSATNPGINWNTSPAQCIVITNNSSTTGDNVKVFIKVEYFQT